MTEEGRGEGEKTREVAVKRGNLVPAAAWIKGREIPFEIGPRDDDDDDDDDLFIPALSSHGMFRMEE